MNRPGHLARTHSPEGTTIWVPLSLRGHSDPFTDSRAATAKMELDLVSSLQQRGVALARLSPQQGRTLLRVYIHARRFFESTSPLEKQNCQLLIEAAAALGPAPVLVGYRELSTKALVRLIGRTPPRLPTALRRAAMQTKHLLDGLLMRALKECLQLGGHDVSARSLRQLCRGACPLE